MTIATQTQARPSTRGWALLTIMQEWQDKLAKRRAYRRTVDELSALSDRELADLGINRSLITTTAEAAVNSTRS